MSKMPELIARHSVINYRCAGCWGCLQLKWVIAADGELERTEEGEVLCEVVCQRDQVDLGFVSKHYIDKVTLLDFENAFEVKRDLVNMGMIANG